MPIRSGPSRTASRGCEVTHRISLWGTLFASILLMPAVCCLAEGAPEFTANDLLGEYESSPLAEGDTRLPQCVATTPATHGVVYDDGWILRPFDPQQTPFELK